MISFFLIMLVLAATLVIGGLIAFTACTAFWVTKVVPPLGRFLDLAGTRIHYLDKGQGPPIVMIHGLGGQMRHFTYSLLDRLSGEFRVVLIDRPGSGYSTRAPGASARLQAQAETIARVIWALGLERPLVVGHSLGGALALALALDHPDCVGGLALVAPLTQVQDEVPPAFRGLVIRSPLLRRIMAWTLATPLGMSRGPEILATIFAPEPVPADFPIRAGSLLGLRPAAFYATSSDLIAANLSALVERYSTITVPVGILYGKDDRILDPQRHGAGLKAALPNAELTMVPGGHMLPLTAPDLVADWIRTQAARVGASKAV